MNIAPKTAAAGFIGAITVILVWIVGQFGVTIPPEIASAITTVLASLGSYFAPRQQPPPSQ